MASIGHYKLMNLDFSKNSDGYFLNSFDVYQNDQFITQWHEKINDVDDIIVNDIIHYQKMSNLARDIFLRYPFLYPKEVVILIEKMPVDQFEFTPYEFMMTLQYLYHLEQKHIDIKLNNPQMIYCAIHKRDSDYIIYTHSLFDSRIRKTDEWHILISYDILCAHSN